MEWFNLSPYWHELKILADTIHNKKSTISSSRDFNIKNSRFYGFLGEQTVSLKLGIPINKSILPNFQGDGGQDFENCDVKSVTYWRDPWLKLETNLIKAKYYILVGLDLEDKRGWIPGFATNEEISNSQIKDWGYGKRFSIHYSKLSPIEELPI